MERAKNEAEKQELHHVVKMDHSSAHNCVDYSSCESKLKHITTGGHGSKLCSEIYEGIATSDSPSTYQSAIRLELQGYVILLFSGWFLGIAGTAVRNCETNYSYDTLETVNLISIQLLISTNLYILIFSSYRTIFRSFTRNDYMTLAVRGVLGFITMTFLSASLKVLPAGYALSIFYTSPILSIFMSSVILSERPALSCYISSVVAFLGVVMVSYQSSSSHISMFGIFLALFGALFGATIPIAIRALVSTKHFITSPLSLGIACYVFSAICGKAVSPIPILISGDLNYIFYSFLPGTCASIGQVLLGIAFQFCNASTGAVLRNFEIPSAYLSALLLLNERPIIIRLLGSGLIVLSTIIVTLGKMYKF